MDKDIAIIGGGPSGYEAAIRAAQLGAKVCLVEKGKLGGTCLNKGCIPTKALYRNAEILNNMKHADDFGITVDNYSIDVDKIQSRKQSIVDQLVGGIAQLIKANNIEFIQGSCRLIDKETLEITLENGELRTITAKNIVIATGSKFTVPNIPGVELPGILYSDDILDFKEIPKSLAIIGGGVIGMEFAGIFNSMGTKVSVIEFMPSILPQVDSDLTKRLVPLLKKKGMEINVSTKVMRIEKEEDNFLIYCEGKKGEIVIEAKDVLIAVGRNPVINGLDIEKVGINFDKKGICVDENNETNIKGIYAVGDVNGKIMLAHAASHQGIKTVEHILGIDNTKKVDIIPNCIFIFPEISSVGITEEEAKNKNIEYKTSKFMFGANGKALTLGEPEGMVKVISSTKSGKDKILGVHIMGAHASDLIHEAVLAINNDMDIEDIISTVHAHPTLSEVFLEAVMGLKGESIHMIPSKKQGQTT